MNKTAKLRGNTIISIKSLMNLPVRRKEKNVYVNINYWSVGTELPLG